MMGVADFPLEILKAFNGKGTDEIKASETDKRPSMNPATSSTTNVQASSSRPSSAALVISEKETTSLPSNSGRSSPAALNRFPSPSLQQEQGQGSQVSLGNSAQEPAQPLKNHEPSEQSLNVDATDPKTRLNQADQSSAERAGRQISFDTAIGAGKGVGRIVGAGLKSPMDFTLGLARGFHNAPKLYGDESVRQSDKITGFQSGLKAAGKVYLVS
jgi:hypothetical protein